MFGTLNKVGDLLFPLFSSLSIELNFFSKQKIALDLQMTSKFRDSKLKSDELNHLSIKKNLWKDMLHAPKLDCKEVKFSGPYGSLEVI